MKIHKKLYYENFINQPTMAKNLNIFDFPKYLVFTIENWAFASSWVVISKSGFEVHTTKLQWASWHENVENRLVVWVWAAFERRGCFYPHFHFFQMLPSLNRLTDFNGLCTNSWKLVSCLCTSTSEFENGDTKGRIRNNTFWQNVTRIKISKNMWTTVQE